MKRAWYGAFFDKATNESRFVVLGWGVFAGTPGLRSARFSVSVALRRKWEFQLADVSTAFLRAPPTEGEDVFVRAPNWVEATVVWELGKAMYG